MEEMRGWMKCGWEEEREKKREKEEEINIIYIYINFLHKNSIKMI